MPVPTSITDLSTTAASNSPAGADAVFPNLDDYLRAHAAFIAQLNATDATKVAKAGDTMTGPLVLNADPSVALGAATKGYVDTGLSGKAAAAHTHAWSAIANRLYSDGTDTGDPNSTGEPFMVTNHANGPLGAGTYFYIWTGWHGGTNYMAQVAVEIVSGAPRTYTRSKTSGTWYAWVRCDLGEGLTRSIGTSGYAKIPGAGGLMIQWGYWTNASASGNVIFTVAFPSTAFAVTVVDGTYFNGGHQTYVQSMSSSGFTWARGSPAASATSYWIAVGV